MGSTGGWTRAFAAPAPKCWRVRPGLGVPANEHTFWFRLQVTFGPGRNTGLGGGAGAAAALGAAFVVLGAGLLAQPARMATAAQQPRMTRGFMTVLRR